MSGVKTLRGLLVHERLSLKGTFYMMGVINIIGVSLILYYFNKDPLAGSAMFIIAEAYLTMFSIICCSSAIAERTTKWYEYALAAPIRAGEYIKAKYIINLLWITAQNIILLLIYTVLSMKYELGFNAAVILFFALVMVVLSSFFYPLLFRERYKAVYVIMIIFIGIFCSIFSGSMVASLTGSPDSLSLKLARMLSDVSVYIWPAAGIFAACVVFFSYKAACRNFRKLVS